MDNMKTAEVEINKRFSFSLNDKEHRAFKTKCSSQGREMSEVLREFMREFVKGKRK